MSHSDTLKTKYRESASFFLNLADQISIQSNGAQQRKENKVLFSPPSSAKSLILRSLYERNISGPVDENMITRTGIENSSPSCPTEVANLIRSGGKTDSITSEARKYEIKRLNAHMESLNKCLLENNEIDCATSLIQKLAQLLTAGMIENSSIQRNVVSEDFYCTCCGSCLFPLHLSARLEMNIKVNRLRRSATARRRASRHVAKQFNFDKNVIQKHRGGGRTFSNATNSHGSAVANVMDTRIILKKNHRQRRPHDGLAHNKIVFKCIGCNHKKEFRGPPHCVKPIENEVITSISNQKKTMTSLASSNAVMERTQTEVEFLSFSDKSLSEAIESSKINLSANPKKKKKRVSETHKKSNLQSFLSSLND